MACLFNAARVGLLSCEVLQTVVSMLLEMLPKCCSLYLMESILGESRSSDSLFKVTI